jgi:Ca2+-binding RTX toxin-like protein
MAPPFFNLTIVGVNGNVNPSGDTAALDISENQQTNAVLGKLAGFDPNEDLSKLIITPNSASFGDDSGRYGVMRATSDDMVNNQWKKDDWIVYVKDGGSLNFNFEDRNGPTNTWTNKISFTVTFQPNYLQKADYGVDLAFNIKDVNEAPTDIVFSNQQAVQAGTVANSNVVKATAAADPDLFNASFRTNVYEFSNGSTTKGKFTIDASTGQITTNDVLTAADAGQTSLDVVIRHSTNPSIKYTETVTFNVAGAPAPPPVVTIGAASQASVVEGGAGTTKDVTFTLTRTGDLSAGSTVNWAVTGASIDGNDFQTPTSGQAVFAANSNTATITVTVKGDAAVEPDETFTVNITPAANGNATIGATASASATITNDDVAPGLPTVSIAVQDAVKNEGDANQTAFTFTVTRTGDTSDTSTVDWIFSGSGIIDPAETDDVSGQTNGQVTFLAGETIKTITVFIKGDTAVEGHEDFTVTLTNPNKATITTASASGTINNDDVAASGSVISIDPLNAVQAEGHAGTTAFTFTVTRSSSVGVSNVDWLFVGNGDDPAAWSDVQGSSGTVGFADGDTSATITVLVKGDSSDENNEGFSIVLLNPNNGTISKTNGIANGTIQDDDNPPDDITLTNANPSVRELDGTIAGVAPIVVGTLGAHDLDQNSGFTFKLLDTADGRFKLASDQNGTHLLVDNGFLLDFEQAASHKVKVEVTDNTGKTYVEEISIAVTDWTTEATAGSLANDVFKGGALVDSFVGNAGNDKLYGGGGNDKLYGGTGNDYIWGGAGKDTLYGNTGKDFFVFDSFNAKTNKKTNVDAIKDFKVKDDSIYLDNAVFKALGKTGTLTKPAKMKKDAFFIGSKAQDKEDRIIYDNKKGVLYYDADGSGKGAAVQIATLSKKLLMTEKDFFII